VARAGSATDVKRGPLGGRAQLALNDFQRLGLELGEGSRLLTRKAEGAANLVFVALAVFVEEGHERLRRSVRRMSEHIGLSERPD
jgi:hypothetical protein